MLCGVEKLDEVEEATEVVMEEAAEDVVVDVASVRSGVACPDVTEEEREYLRTQRLL